MENKMGFLRSLQCHPRRCTQAATTLSDPLTADYADFADGFGVAFAFIRFIRAIRGQNIWGIPFGCGCAALGSLEFEK